MGKSGILLHPTALPSPYGIGDFGPGAYKFVNFLAQAGQKFWQVLPLNETFSGSPYDAISAFAGNPLLISFELLYKDGFLKKMPSYYSSQKINFRKLRNFKNKILRSAFLSFKENADFEKFCSENYFWLEDYSLFVVLKEKFKKPWWEWPCKYKNAYPQALEDFRRKFHNEIRYKKFVQWVFFGQFWKLKNYAAKKGVGFIGDLPIYVSLDSADVWSKKELFYLNKNGKPVFVAGVPPDYFSRTGQRWGNPVYRWKNMEKDNFNWWWRRFSMALKMFDYVRIDHFRGFSAFWAVPARMKTALKGKWVPAPGIKLFESMKGRMRMTFIAEDLGYITPAVKKLRDRFGFPGMKVLQFGFYTNLKSPFLPHNYPRNCVAYTGTHDNDTTVGWWKALSPKIKEKVKHYVEKQGFEWDEKNIHWIFAKLLLSSKAKFVIFPLQSLLGLDSRARFNTPATSRGNWIWRMEPGSITREFTENLRTITKKYRR